MKPSFRLSGAAIITAALLCCPTAETAHLADDIGPLRGNVWLQWDFSPLIIIGCVFVLTVFFRGLRRRRVRRPGDLRKAVFFAAGITLTYVVLQTPMDALSDHIFWIHRIQHLALHHCIPMLLALAAPAPELIRGLPARLRRRLLKPVMRNRGVSKTYAFIQHPVIAPLLFVGLIGFWLQPTMFQIATLNETVHDIMHFSMLIEGIPFWWLMLDPTPGRISYLRRLVILWIITLPQIVIGAYIALTHTMLYPIYAHLDPGWVSSYAVDQQLGGLVVWIPGAMMSVIAVIIVLHFCSHHERRATEKRPAVSHNRSENEPTAPLDTLPSHE